MHSQQREQTDCMANTDTAATREDYVSLNPTCTSSDRDRRQCCKIIMITPNTHSSQYWGGALLNSQLNGDFS